MKRKVSILLIITMIISMFTLSGCGVAEESADEFEHRGGLITGYKGNSEKFKIPDKIDGYLVKGIDRWAFRGRSAIKEIVIPDSVITIGDLAFWKCKGLTSIAIPSSVTKLGQEAFSGCTSLTSISIPDSVTKLYPGTFMNCTSLSSVKLPNGIDEIPDYAFYNCTSLRTLTIPDSVTIISWRYPFEGCKDLTVTYKGKQYKYNEETGSLGREFYEAVQER